MHEIEHPTGSLRLYLKHADVVAVVGNSMFVHGAVDKDTARFVPHYNTRFENPTSKPPPYKMCDTVSEWVTSMNDYLRNGLRDYEERPLWDKDRKTRGGESLMALQNRPASKYLGLAIFLLACHFAISLTHIFLFARPNPISVGQVYC